MTLVRPGEDVQAVLDRYPGGGIWLAKGTHPITAPLRVSGRIWGEFGAIVHGGGLPHAFDPNSTVQDVTIENIAFEAFRGAPQAGVIDLKQAVRWTLQSIAIRGSEHWGLGVHSGMIVRDSQIVDCGHLGVGGPGTVDLQLIHTEIGRCNENLAFDPGWEAGGVKLTSATRPLLQDVWIHHVGGPAAWFDCNCVDGKFINVLAEDAYAIGLFSEISRGALIDGCTVRRVTKRDPDTGALITDPYQVAAILVASAPQTIVRKNTIEACGSGIVGLAQRRMATSVGCTETATQIWLENMLVDQNTVTQQDGFAACVICDIAGDTSVFTARNNRFTNNRYALSGSATFGWMNGPRGFAEWQAYGQDVAGSLL